MKQKIKKLKLNDSGQVTIEFVFSFAFASIFILFFIYYMINIGVGYLAHYATFQASRTFLTYDRGGNSLTGNESFAIRAAKEEFERYSLKSFGIKYEGDGIQFNTPYEGRVVYDFVGAYLLFKPPFVFGESESKKDHYLTESFLGKEPSKADCACQILQAMGVKGCNGGSVPAQTDDITIYDNGC